MIRIEDLTKWDKGRGVLFHTLHGTTERGVISSWNDQWVFCRFGEGSTAAACDPKQLTWEHSRQVEASLRYQKVVLSRYWKVAS